MITITRSTSPPGTKLLSQAPLKHHSVDNTCVIAITIRSNQSYHESGLVTGWFVQHNTNKYKNKI